MVQRLQGLGGATPPCQKFPSSSVNPLGFPSVIELYVTCACVTKELRINNRARIGM
jgi:hypothetical protein